MADDACGQDSVADVLTEKFTSSYPHIPISRPTRFLDTVRRLAAPTKSSAVGEKKLLGSPLVTYRRRVWVPRNRHKQGTCTCICIYALRNCLVYSLCTFNADSSIFPMNVQQSGVSENMLQKAFLQCLEGGQDLCWTLAKPVTVGFYRDLHHYFRQWPPARSATQKTVGRFYLLIDVHFQFKKMSSRPDNVYTLNFVQRVAESSRLNSEPMYYGADVTVQQLKGQVSAYQENLEVMSLKLSKQKEVLEEMKKQIEIADSELAASRHALSDVTNRLENTRKQRDAARKHVCRFEAKLEAASLDSMYYED